MPILFRDIETRSALNLKKVGAWRYSGDPATDVLCVAFAVDDGPIEIWTPGMPVPEAFIAAARDPDWLVCAHSDAFERAVEERILQPRYGWPLIPIERHRCTMATALASALPGSLEGAAAALGLPTQKDVDGQRAMLQMAKPRKPRKGEDPDALHWHDAPEQHHRLQAYCRRDVEVERELFRRLPPLSAAEQRLWELDAVINRRGFHVDVRLAEAARRIVRERRVAIDRELAELTGGRVTGINQVAKLQALVEDAGHNVQGLTKRSVSAILAHGPSDEIKQLLELRREGAKASAGKLDTLLAWANADRLHDTLKYYGAATGRWSGAGFQPHNLARAQPDDLDAAIAAISSGDLARVTAIGPPLAMVASLSRAMICAAPGHTLVGADFSSIEARILAWLAGETWKVDLFHRNEDPYCAVASKVFRRPIGPDDEERQIGKFLELAFGFGGALGAFKPIAPDSGFSDAEIENFKQQWRAAHPAIVSFWRGLFGALKRALRTGQPVAFKNFRAEQRAGNLYLKLPSGRELVYPEARIVTGQYDDEIAFKDNARGKWQEVNEWFGTFVENAVQAIARDLLAAAMLRVEAAGFPIVLHVHDELVCEVPEDFDAAERFNASMIALPEWATGLPIAAKGWQRQRYAKAATAPETIIENAPPIVNAPPLIPAIATLGAYSTFTATSTVLKPAPVPIKAEAARFLALLDPAATDWTFQTFDDDGERKRARAEKLAMTNKERVARGKPPLKKVDPFARIRHGTLDQRWNELCRLNADGAGVFVTINATDGKGRETANIVAVRALFLDLDGAPVEPVLQGKPQPHIVVELSPGKFHPYWLTSGIALEEFTPLQKALIARFGGDPAVHDLSRVMRLPGFLHRKDKDKPSSVRIVATHAAPAYTAADFAVVSPAKGNGQPRDGFDGFDDRSPTQRLNDAALTNLAAWVPEIFPTARAYHDGYRVSSAELGRDLEEDLSLVPQGIKDFGLHDQDDPLGGKRTPIDIVMQYKFGATVEAIARRECGVEFEQAVAWLQARLPEQDEQPTAEMAYATPIETLTLGGQRERKANAAAALQSVNAATVTMVAVDWLWPDRFAIGKLGIIAGLPDEGKGQLICYIAAQVSNAGTWPCGEGYARQGNVILLTAEDDLSDTVVPRLAAAGADLNRITIVKMVHEQGKERMFSLVTDLEMLRQKIVEAGNVALVLIDPISAYLGVGKVDSYRTTDVRAVLGPVVSLAAEMKCSIIGIMHFNKKVDVTNALLRISDSLAYGATARHVYGVIDDHDNQRKLVVRAKNNLARYSDKALAFKFGAREVGTDATTGEQIWAPYLIWETEHIDVTATEAMQAANEFKSPTARDSAKQFLHDLLAAGPVASSEVDEAAKANGVSKRTLYRAKNELNIIAKKDNSTPDGVWTWRLPDGDGIARASGV